MHAPELSRSYGQLRLAGITGASFGKAGYVPKLFQVALTKRASADHSQIFCVSGRVLFLASVDNRNRQRVTEPNVCIYTVRPLQTAPHYITF